LLSRSIEYMEYIMEMEFSSALEHWRIKIHVHRKNEGKWVAVRFIKWR
jgi:hypothetical protein